MTNPPAPSSHLRAAAAILVAAWLALPAPAAAQECLTADPPPVTRPAQPLRFGITPGAAGSAGVTQAQVAPIDEAREVAALQQLRPGRRELVLRLNRLFWNEGDAAIARFEALVDRYARAGLRSEIQVRFHPPEGGDLAGWETFVRSAVRRLGARPAVIGFSITNEANFPASPNTSDGAYEGVVDALVRGIAVAREELDALGRPGLPLGFNVMWRWTPESDAAFWREVGAKATPAFRRALTYVGMQVYPGLVWPPAGRPGVTAGDETLEALTLIRRCYMPMAGLGDDVGLWVTENGYATNLGRTEAEQAGAMESTVRAVHGHSGELGVSDYRWFNLRDNNSDGTDLFAAVGLLRDDYSPKPAFPIFASLVEELGADRPAEPRRLTVRVIRRGGRIVVAGSGVCGGRATIRLLRGRRVLARSSAAIRDCRFRRTLLRPRGVRVVEVRAGGQRVRRRI